jgi:hypothetical protein
MTDLLDFKNFRATVKELERLLDYVFIGAGLLRSANDTIFINRKEPISSWIEQLLHADRIGDSKSKAYLLSKIAILILDLQCIEENRPELLAHFQSKFRKHTENEFWGLRFEVDIASTLAKKEILFTPGEDCPEARVSTVTLSAAKRRLSAHQFMHQKSKGLIHMPKRSRGQSGGRRKKHTAPIT